MAKKIYLVALATLLGSVAINAVICRHITSQGNQPANTSAAVCSVPEGGYVDLTYAAEKSVGSVVFIKISQTARQQRYYDPFEEFFGGWPYGQRRQQQQQPSTPRVVGSGSGVIISADGYIVTNNHVVEQADELDVKLNDGREFKARIIGTDKATDLALIKVEAKDLPAIAIGDSDQLKIGQWVLAVGNPFNLTSTVTAGIVSAKARSLGANGVESFIQTDAAINQGNSGGALVNERGELVGINAMLYSQTGSYSGYGFAIPTTIMNKVVGDLKEFGTVQRAVLGVTGNDLDKYLDAERAKGNSHDFGTLTGIYIAEVGDKTAAESAGLKTGDVITALDGKDVHRMSELQEILAQHRPGDKVKVTYMRDKKSHTASATLLNQQGTTVVIEHVDMDLMGAAMRPLSDELKAQLGLRYGLEVQAVKAGKMKDAGITKGLIILRVNDTPMTTVEDFENAVKDANMSPDRTLWISAITPSGRKQAFVIEL